MLLRADCIQVDAAVVQVSSLLDQACIFFGDPVILAHREPDFHIGQNILKFPA